MRPSSNRRFRLYSPHRTEDSRQVPPRCCSHPPIDIRVAIPRPGSIGVPVTPVALLRDPTLDKGERAISGVKVAEGARGSGIGLPGRHHRVLGTLVGVLLIVSVGVLLH